MPDAINSNINSSSSIEMYRHKQQRNGGKASVATAWRNGVENMYVVA